MLRLALIAALAGPSFWVPRPSHALTTGGLSGSSSVSIGTVSATTVSSALITITTVAGLMYLWDAIHTRRAYRHAADVARARLSIGDSRPLTNSDPGGVLRAVADIERSIADPGNEVTLARRIIARADAFEQLN